MQSGKLILIRHGETEDSREKRYCGFSNLSLNRRGILQAKGLLRKLKEVRVDKVYSSDLMRASQTAGIIFANLPVEEKKSLREMNFGIFEGLTYQELMRKHAEIYSKWIANPCAVSIPSGESLNNLAKRVREGLTRILSQNRQRTVALVTHAGPISVILCDIAGLDLSKIWQIKVDLASVNIIEFSKGSGRVCSTEQSKLCHYNACIR